MSMGCKGNSDITGRSGDQSTALIFGTLPTITTLSIFGRPEFAWALRVFVIVGKHTALIIFTLAPRCLPCHDGHLIWSPLGNRLGGRLKNGGYHLGLVLKPGS